MLNYNEIEARLVRQNNQEFLVSVFKIRQILTFTRYTQRLIVGYDENNLPIYNNEIQRKTETSRVDKIADFLINDPDATFPTNIVISIPKPVIQAMDQLSEDRVKITLDTLVFTEIKKGDGDVHLTIIDGQHRIKGIEQAIERLEKDIKSINGVLTGNPINAALLAQLDQYSKRLTSLKEIELMVSFFVDPTLEFQAMIFSTINRTQKSVPQSLVYELFGLTSSDSPQKTALQTVLSLNSYEGSPLYERVKLHGGSYERNMSPPLTQAGMVKSIIDLICTNLRDSENDRFRPRKDLIKNISEKLYFRRYYANNQDDKIADILFAYFTAVRNSFKNGNGQSYWDFIGTTKPVNVLQTTVGFQALLDLLGDILIKVEENDRDKVAVYESFLKRANTLLFENTDRYPFTSKTRKVFYYDLSLKIWPPANKDDERLIKLDNALKE